jgi:hypothetical protein
MPRVTGAPKQQARSPSRSAAQKLSRSAAQRTRQLVSPRPDAQRSLPSEKEEQTRPAVHSLLLVQRSHSVPSLPQEPIGSATASRSPQVRSFLVIDAILVALGASNRL